MKDWIDELVKYMLRFAVIVVLLAGGLHFKLTAPEMHHD